MWLNLTHAPRVITVVDPKQLAVSPWWVGGFHGSDDCKITPKGLVNGLVCYWLCIPHYYLFISSSQSIFWDLPKALSIASEWNDSQPEKLYDPPRHSNVPEPGRSRTCNSSFENTTVVRFSPQLGKLSSHIATSCQAFFFKSWYAINLADDT
jgi:hypothetical protein